MSAILSIYCVDFVSMYGVDSLCQSIVSMGSQTGEAQAALLLQATAQEVNAIYPYQSDWRRPYFAQPFGHADLSLATSVLSPLRGHLRSAPTTD